MQLFPRQVSSYDFGTKELGTVEIMRPLRFSRQCTGEIVSRVICIVILSVVCAVKISDE